MGIAMITIAISSCTEDTMTLGNTLVNSADQFVITSDTFDVSTRSIIADSVLARSTYRLRIPKPVRISRQIS